VISAGWRAQVTTKREASLLDPEDQQLSKAEIERIRGLIDSNS
jgi:hypothetical protein